MPLRIIRNDITKLNIDAIVNAANEKLLAGEGVCGAIFAAAGADQLQAECNKIGHCDIGNAVITNGYNLLAKYIIHTVGPIYGQNSKKEENQLYSCYMSSLNLAKSKKLSYIAFPLISSGIYGYPKAEALKIATRAIKEFLAKEEMDIYLVVYDKKTFEKIGKLFKKVQSFINETLIIPETNRQLNSYEMQMSIPINLSEECTGQTAKNLLKKRNLKDFWFIRMSKHFPKCFFDCLMRRVRQMLKCINGQISIENCFQKLGARIILRKSTR